MHLNTRVLNSTSLLPFLSFIELSAEVCLLRRRQQRVGGPARSSIPKSSVIVTGVGDAWLARRLSKSANNSRIGAAEPSAVSIGNVVRRVLRSVEGLERMDCQLVRCFLRFQPLANGSNFTFQLVASWSWCWSQVCRFHACSR